MFPTHLVKFLLGNIASMLWESVAKPSFGWSYVYKIFTLKIKEISIMCSLCKGVSDLKPCLDYCEYSARSVKIWILFERSLDFSMQHIIWDKWAGKFKHSLPLSTTLSDYPLQFFFAEKVVRPFEQVTDKLKERKKQITAQCSQFKKIICDIITFLFISKFITF